MIICGRKIFALMKMILFDCKHLFSVLQIHDYHNGLWEDHQPKEKVAEITIPINKMLEINVPFTKEHESTIPKNIVDK